MKVEPKLQALRKFLSAGKTVREAAACAGIGPDELPDILETIENDRKNDSLPISQVGFSRMMIAVDVLEDIALHSDDERARQAAAKALLDFALQSQKLRSTTEAMSKLEKKENGPQLVLWDFT